VLAAAVVLAALILGASLGRRAGPSRPGRRPPGGIRPSSWP